MPIKYDYFWGTPWKFKSSFRFKGTIPNGRLYSFQPSFFRGFRCQRGGKINGRNLQPSPIQKGIWSSIHLIDLGHPPSMIWVSLQNFGGNFRSTRSLVDSFTVPTVPEKVPPCGGAMCRIGSIWAGSPPRPVRRSKARVNVERERGWLGVLMVLGGTPGPKIDGNLWKFALIKIFFFLKFEVWWFFLKYRPS